MSAYSAGYDFTIFNVAQTITLLHAKRGSLSALAMYSQCNINDKSHAGDHFMSCTGQDSYGQQTVPTATVTTNRFKTSAVMY